MERPSDTRTRRICIMLIRENARRNTRAPHHKHTTTTTTTNIGVHTASQPLRKRLKQADFRTCWRAAQMAPPYFLLKHVGAKIRSKNRPNFPQTRFAASSGPVGPPFELNNQFLTECMYARLLLFAEAHQFPGFTTPTLSTGTPIWRRQECAKICRSGNTQFSYPKALSLRDASTMFWFLSDHGRHGIVCCCHTSLKQLCV